MIRKVGAGFRKRSCSNNKLERDGDSKKSHRSLKYLAEKLARRFFRYRDLIRGGHYGQRSCEPRQRAEHMAAPTSDARAGNIRAYT
jgi:hypothetical protein